MSKIKMQDSEAILKIPNELCQHIYNCEFEIDIGNVDEHLIAKTIELYSEAINFYLSQGTLNAAVKKRTEFYQEKIKKLLVRRDVQKCLGGHKINPRAIDLQHELNKVHESAPEQAKALVEFYKNQIANHQQLISTSMQEQNRKLNERIARRSRSKSNNYGSSPAKSSASTLASSLILEEKLNMDRL